jgi:ATP-dependent RNA helicase RhlE
METTTPQQNPSFYGLGIAPNILETLDKLKFTVPTPIQYKAIPIAITGKDIIGVAQTGTGKTLAFGIPMIQRLAQQRGRALVLVPTRELAFQVNETLEKLSIPAGMPTSLLIGGESMLFQILALRKNPRIIVATPGRLIDLIGQHILRLDDVHLVVLDEADRMFDMGFAPQIEQVLRTIPKERQTMLFSATMPPDIVKMASRYMQLPIRTEIAPPGTMAEHISQELYIVKKDLKNRILSKLLDQYTGTVLLFTRTKRGASQVTREVRYMGHSVAEIHSDRTLEQRFEALEGFKSGLYRILVATDIAARGIDVTGIELVINYDLPDDPDNYVHRIGRTARAGHEGRAITFATPDQGQDVKNIEQLIRVAIPVATHPAVPAAKFSELRAGEPHQHGGGRPHHRPSGQHGGSSYHHSRGHHTSHGRSR